MKLRLDWNEFVGNVKQHVETGKANLSVEHSDLCGADVADVVGILRDQEKIDCDDLVEDPDTVWDMSLSRFYERLVAYDQAA